MGKNQAKDIRGVRALMAIASLVTVLGFGAVMQQFLYPAAPSSATTTSGAEVGLNIKDFIKVAVDTSELALADGSGNTTITPEPTGTLITGDVNVAVTTNTPMGYALSVYTEDGSTSMTHSDTTVDNEIESIDTISGYDATTGVSTLSNNTWGFRKRTTSGLSNWYAVGENEDNGTVLANTDTGSPAYCEALSYPLESSGCDAGSYETHAVNFGAKLTPELPSGTYTNNVVFSAVAKSEGTRYTLQFNSNGGENTMGPRTIVKGSTMTLPTKGFVKEGYVIKGWALTQEDAEIATSNNINGTSNPTTNPTYTSGQIVEVTDLILNAIAAGQAVEQNALINIYAIWGSQFTLTLANGNTTAISTINPAADVYTYNPGDSITVTCTPASGYHCTEWVSSNTSTLPSYTGNTATGNYTYTFAMPASNITLTANGAPNTFTINYNANTGTGTTSPTTVTYGENVTLATNAFTAPSGMRFKEWNTSDNGSGTSYPSGQSGIAPATLKSSITTTNGGSITLYAIWEGTLTFAAAGIAANSNMQSIPSGACAKVATGEYTTLNDSRDNNKYVVKKLPDGNCWMVQNLRLINKTISSSDSNVSSNFTVPTSTAASSSWCTKSSTECDDQPLAYYDSSTRSSYGALYNWYTATAGTGTYSMSSGTATSSICPKGWRLPTGGSSGEFRALDIAWGGTGSGRSNANTYSTFTGDYTSGNNGGFDLPGYINGSKLSLVGSYGRWWSATVHSSNNAYILGLSSGNTNVNPQNNGFKYVGFSVRCIASI